MLKYKYDREVLRVVQEVIYAISPRWKMSHDKEDLMQAGRIGAWYGEQHYNPEHDIPFNDYLILTIRWAIYDELRRLDYIPRHVREQINNDGLANVPFSGFSTEYLAEFRHALQDDNDQPYSSYLYNELLELLQEADKGAHQGLLLGYACGLSKDDLSIIHGIEHAMIWKIIALKKELFLQILTRKTLC